MNPQNFNRDGALRAAILAPAGHLIAVADSGQIEARVVAWLAGQRETLETFRRNDESGGDFYSDEGSRYFRKKLSKAETPIERQISKSMVLGLGFGMAWLTFALNLLKGMLGADPVQFGVREVEAFRVQVDEFERQPWGRGSTCGDEVQGMIDTLGVRLPYQELLTHCAVTAHFVHLYRTANPRIANTWRTMNNVIEVMARPGPADEVRMKLGCMQVIREGLIKPSGLILRYPNLKRTSSGWIYTGGESGREVKKIYGGLLTENIVQSLARDVVAWQALWISTRYPIGTTTHDEVVTVPREADAPECLRYMKERMRVAPDWCADLPLNASGGIARSYAEAK